jgi:Succinylglutamate desuccinylase / Aspartoacylase family
MTRSMLVAESSRAPRVRSYTREVEARLDRLRGIKTMTLGVAEYAGTSYPIKACVVEGSGPPRRPWVLISGGVHGDEIAGVYAAVEFLETRAPRLSESYQLAVLPCVNPSGFEHNTLETANGANLNRLFGTRSTQPEVTLVQAWLETLDVQFLATFDLHEVAPNYRGEGFVESDNPRGCYLYETQVDHPRRIGRAMIDALPPDFEVCRWPIIYRDRSHEGLISYPEDCENPIYSEQTTLDAYLNGRFTRHSFTLETPQDWRLEKRVQTHLLWLDKALALLKTAQ